MHHQGPQHCLAKCWLVSISLRMQLPAQGSQRALLHLAAPTCCACCRALMSTGRGHRAPWGKGTGAGAEPQGAEGERARSVGDFGEAALQTPRRTIAPPTIWQGPEGYCCQQASMRQTNALCQVAAHASSRSPALPCVTLAFTQGCKYLLSCHS
jgi:hypothetical protein